MNTSTTPRFANVNVQLSGKDGNIFGIIGRVRHALAEAGATKEDLDSFWEGVSSASSYENAIEIISRWVNIS